nr:MAG TPA: hypothetical protein [Bacteriophage sp.]
MKKFSTFQNYFQIVPSQLYTQVVYPLDSQLLT